MKLNHRGHWSHVKNNSGIGIATIFWNPLLGKKFARLDNPAQLCCFLVCWWHGMTNSQLGSMWLEASCTASHRPAPAVRSGRALAASVYC